MARPLDIGLVTTPNGTGDQYHVRRLARLRAHRIAPGEIDIRGWLVFAEDGRRVGRVRDIVVNVQTLAMRHLELQLDPHIVNFSGSRRVIVPIAYARVSAHRPHLHLVDVTSGELAHSPRFGASPLGATEERLLFSFFKGNLSLAAELDEPFKAEMLEDDFWGVRRIRRAARPYLVRCNDTSHR